MNLLSFFDSQIEFVKIEVTQFNLIRTKQFPNVLLIFFHSSA